MKSDIPHTSHNLPNRLVGKTHEEREKSVVKRSIEESIYDMFCRSQFALRITCIHEVNSVVLMEAQFRYRLPISHGSVYSVLKGNRRRSIFDICTSFFLPQKYEERFILPCKARQRDLCDPLEFWPFSFHPYRNRFIYESGEPVAILSTSDDDR